MEGEIKKMINNFSFIVPGAPVGKERPRKGKHGFYTPKRTQDYESLIAWHASAALLNKKINDPSQPWLMDQVYSVEIKISRENVKKKPDIDNVLKSILDGMNKIVYHDDKQVWKVYIEYIDPSNINQVAIWVQYAT